MYDRRYVDLTLDSLRDPVAVVGLPGIANVGKIAAEALVSILDAELVLEFFSDDFPPRVIVKDGITRFPKSSLYVYRGAPDEPHDVVILTADYQPSSSQGVYSYADYTVREFVKLGVKSVFALAAYEQEYRDFFASLSGGPHVYVSASSQRLLDSICTQSGTLVTSEGVINGANGFIPAWAATMFDMESACLLGETMGMIKMDYRAAKAVLEVMGSVLELSAEFGALDSQVSQVTQFIEWARTELEQSQRASDSDERPSDRYIG
jgi:proteasome assembly chaperone (PAC2) family protein